MTTSDIAALLKSNSYPGRSILLGRSPDGTHGVLAYFIMGRSENSRNRVFSVTEDGIRTEARDPAKLTDPALIIYHPVRTLGGVTVVANGDHADSIRDALAEGGNLYSALQARTFEPDSPHFTPRISGILQPDGSYMLSILRTVCGDPYGCCRSFWDYRRPQAGIGHFLHTYRGDGDPLPSFEGDPVPVAIPSPDAASFGELLWTHLNPENRISLFVRYVDLAAGRRKDVIRNRF